MTAQAGIQQLGARFFGVRMRFRQLLEPRQGRSVMNLCGTSCAHPGIMSSNHAKALRRLSMSILAAGENDGIFFLILEEKLGPCSAHHGIIRRATHVAGV